MFVGFGHNFAIILRKPQNLKVLHLLIELGKQYKMTKIVRAALGLPNLRLGPLFQITQTKKLGFVQMGLFRSLGHSVFEFVSDFDIRVSNLEMAITQIPVRGYPKARSSGPGLFARSKSIRGRPL